MLTELLAEQLPLVLKWRNDPAVRQNMYSYEEISPQEHARWFHSMQTDPGRQYFIFSCAGKPTGVVYFTNLMPFNQQAMWGFYSAPGAPRGTGLQMELEALDFAFIDLSLQKLNCEVIATNKKVINLHRKTGFQDEGLFRDYHFDGHRYIDVVRLGMIRSEWPQAKKALTDRIIRTKTTDTA